MQKINSILKNAKSDKNSIHNGIRQLEDFIGEVETDFIMHSSYSECGSYTVEFIKPDRRFLFSVETDGGLTYATVKTIPKLHIDHGFIHGRNDVLAVFSIMQ